MLAEVSDPVSEWQELLRTDSTRKLYLMSLNAFCNFANRTPVELIKLPKADLGLLVKSYVIHLKRLAVNTAGKPKEGQISVNSIPDKPKAHFIKKHQETTSGDSHLLEKSL